MSSKPTVELKRHLPTTAWAVLTSVSFLPAVPAWWVISYPLLAAASLASTRWRAPLLFLSSYFIAAASIFLNKLFGPVSYFAGLSSLQHLAESPLIVDPQLLFSRALFTFSSYLLLDPGNRAALRAVVWNLVIPTSTFLVLIGFSSTFPLDFSDISVILIVYWVILLLSNLFLAVRCTNDSENVGIRGTPLGIALFGLSSGFILIALLSSFKAKSNFESGGAHTVAIFRPGPRWPDAGEFRTSLSSFGLSSIGLFGDINEFLRRLGYQVVTMDSLTQLRGFSPTILFCPSLYRSLSAAETSYVHQFLRAGGAMIAVGEHTNLDANADRYNSLFRPYGLSLNFDNTNGMFGEGLVGATVSENLVGRAIRSAPLLTHNRGASITVANSSAEAVIVGNYWQADTGDSLAPDKAFLSDGIVSRGDRLGNVILMAEAQAGGGRIFLSGDSSPFLNQNLAYNSLFLANLFRAITLRPTKGLSSTIPLIGVLVTMLVLSIFLRKRKLGPIVLALSTLAVGSALAIEYTIEGRLQSKFEGLQGNNWIVISTAENNVFDRDPFSPKAVTALGLQAFRAGALPVVTSWKKILPYPKAIVILNPAIDPTRKYLEALREKIRKGTHVILAGDGTNQSFKKAAARFGFSVSEQPLGSISSELLTTFTAWRIDSIPKDATPIRVGDEILGGTMPLGDGRVTVLADGGFFLSKNLEMETTYDEENCNFVRSLLEMK